jgi:hypothetical protein
VLYYPKNTTQKYRICGNNKTFPKKYNIHYNISCLQKTSFMNSIKSPTPQPRAFRFAAFRFPLCRFPLSALPLSAFRFAALRV